MALKNEGRCFFIWFLDTSKLALKSSCNFMGGGSSEMDFCHVKRVQTADWSSGSTSHRETTSSIWGEAQKAQQEKHVCTLCFSKCLCYGQTPPMACLYGFYGNPRLQLCNCAPSSSPARRCEHVADPSRGTAQLSWLPLTDLVTVICTKLPQTSEILCEFHRQFP